MSSSQCEFVSNGQQCRFPASMSLGTLGDGRWFCALHHRGPTQAEAAEIVERSLRWDKLPNKAEAWIKMRRAEVYGKGDNPMVAALRKQIEERSNRSELHRIEDQGEG